MIIIGIDPAFRVGGFSIAILDSVAKTIDRIRFKTFIDFLRWYDKQDCKEWMFCIENSNLQNVGFSMKGSKGVIHRKGRNVGTNQAVSQLAVDLCRTRCDNVIELSPKDKGRKWTANIFLATINSLGVKQINKGITSQDDRDAAKMAILALNRLG